MSLSRLDLRGVPAAEIASHLPLVEDGAELPSEEVSRIIAEVRSGGDAAVRELTRRFDGVEPESLRVPRSQIDAALEQIDGRLRAALEHAYARIVAYHSHLPEPAGAFDSEGVVVRELVRPVGRAGLYAPGGRARYPSTVLMCAAPAQVAGVEEIALCAPPSAHGSVAAETLAAAAIAGIREVYAMGGAQAVAAMAFGTQTVKPVDIIVGPGNRYVAEAKRQVSGIVGVPSAFAGPSEVVVVADNSTPAEWAAVDVVVQAEHGPDGLAWLVTWNENVAEDVAAQIELLVQSSPRSEQLRLTLASRGSVVLVDGPSEALAVANTVAPEHLELLVEDAEKYLTMVRSAGAVFCGPYSPASVGDYIAGPNHVLPTARTARFSSALRVDDFRKHIHAVSLSEQALIDLAPEVAVIAAAEGLDAHALSVTLRSERTTSARMSPRLVPLRPDLVALSGYHSPQVEAEVRLNTNESPLAPPGAWLEELRCEMRKIDFNRYPDREALELRTELGKLHGVAPERIFCANGSNEVLQCLLLAYGGRGRKIALFEPTYTLHRHIARVTSTDVVSTSRGPDFEIDVAKADALVNEAQPVIVFLCSPNNPTGLSETLELQQHMLDGSPGLLVVDEAYGQFAPSSALDLVRGGGDSDDRMVVVRTFSKTWSMAACRLGYLVADPAVVEACGDVVLPYHLDALTQLAGRLALRHVTEMEERVALITKERERVSRAFADLAVKAWPSDANFILFRPLERQAKEVWEDLLGSSVLVRDCSRWPGVEGSLRVTIGTPHENDRFLEALAQSLTSAR